MNRLYVLSYNDCIDDDIINYLPSNVKLHLLKRNDKARRESLMGYLLLTYAVSKYYGKLTILDLDYSNNKPFIINSNLKFNLSHSNNTVALAISDEYNIGIDIERIRPLDMRLARRIANDIEIKNIDSGKDLISLWTKKEAFVKLNGDSIFSNIKELKLDSKSYEQIEYKDYIITVYFER